MNQVAENRIRILVADDHTLLREALCDVLRTEPDFEIVADVGDADTVVRVATEVRPDVILLDVEMPGTPTLGTVARLRRTVPEARVIVLSMHDDPELMQDMLRSGARAYLHKSVSRVELVTAIRSVASPGRLVLTITPAAGSGPTGPLLSKREREVVALVAEARSNRQIAAQLAINEGTVKRHLRNIFGKLGAVSRLDAVNKALQAAEIRPRPDLLRHRGGAKPFSGPGRSGRGSAGPGRLPGEDRVSEEG